MRAILFDWDNTLVDTWPLIHHALNVTLREMGHAEWSLEQVRRDVKKSMRDSFPEMFGDRWAEAGRIYQNAYRAIHTTSIRPLPGAQAMLEAIAPDVFAAVVSNKQAESLRKEVPALGWQSHFDALVGATDAARDKPHADPALLALRDSGLTGGPEVWFVGDTDADLGCAQAIGATAILYGEPTGVIHNTLNGYPFHFQVKNHQELARLITQQA